MGWGQKLLALLAAAALLAAGINLVLQGRGRLPEVDGETTVLDKPPADLPRSR